MGLFNCRVVKKPAVIPNLFRNRKGEVDKHRPDDPETSRVTKNCRVGKVKRFPPQDCAKMRPRGFQDRERRQI